MQLQTQTPTTTTSADACSTLTEHSATTARRNRCASIVCTIWPTLQRTQAPKSSRRPMHFRRLRTAPQLAGRTRRPTPEVPRCTRPQAMRPRATEDLRAPAKWALMQIVCMHCIESTTMRRRQQLRRATRPRAQVRRRAQKRSQTRRAKQMQQVPRVRRVNSNNNAHCTAQLRATVCTQIASKL